MMDSGSISEQDLRLVHALQVNPRASFSTLAQVLGVSPATLTRRWEQLRDAGLAWIVATPSARFVTAGCIAYVEVRCRPSLRDEVAARLSRQPDVASLDLTAGPADMLLSIATSDLHALAEYLSTQVNPVPGVLSVNSFLATRSYRQGGDWRLTALSPGQVAALRTPPATEPLPSFTALDRDLLRALGEDGRMSHADLARHTGASPATVRRRLNKLVRSRAIALRCDVAAPAFGWPISTYVSARVAPQHLTDVSQAIARLPQIRLVTNVTGSVNMFLSAWSGSLEAITHLEEQIASRHPAWQPIDRIVVLHAMKRAGRLLDARGRAVGAVPMVYAPG